MDNLYYNKIVKQIELKSRLIADSSLVGMYKSAFKGSGMEYAHSRLFELGDDYRHIDSRLTALNHQVFTKTFEEERLLNVFLLIDISSSMQIGNIGSSKPELVAEISSILASIAFSNGDRVGYATFNDDIVNYVAPQRKMESIAKMLNLILKNDTQGKTNISGVFKRFSNVFNERAIVFVISDFNSQNFNKELSILSKKFDVILINLSKSNTSLVNLGGFINACDSEESTYQTIEMNFIGNRNLQIIDIAKELNVDIINCTDSKGFIDKLKNLMLKRVAQRC